MAARRRLLFVKSRTASFIELDQQLLGEQYELTVIYQPGRFSNPITALKAVIGCDVVVGWWASWHTFLPFTFAWLLRKPSLLIVGGFDTAAEPEFGYGYQLGGVRKHLSRWIMHRAGTLVTNSEYSRREIERNVGIPAAKVELVYHGVPDAAAVSDTGAAPASDTGAAAVSDTGPDTSAPPDSAAPPESVPDTASDTASDTDTAPGKRRLALTVGIVDMTNLTRKGMRPFVEAAAHLPDVDFVLAGSATPEAEQALKAIATANVTLAGWVQADELERLMNEATVYVQASRHEGFGVSLAEAMLHRCVPVATTAGALPEVVGDTGVILRATDGAAVAEGVKAAITISQDPGAGVRARERVQGNFSVDARRDALHRLLRDSLAQRSAGRPPP